jgi:hypothetical protein
MRGKRLGRARDEPLGEFAIVDEATDERQNRVVFEYEGHVSPRVRVPIQPGLPRRIRAKPDYGRVLVVVGVVIITQPA